MCLETVSIIIDENQFHQTKPFVFAPHEGTAKKNTRCRTVLRVVFIGGLDVFEQSLWPIRSSNSMIVDPPTWIWWQIYSADRVPGRHSAVLSRYPRCSVTLFSVNVWGDLNVLNPANSLDVFTFFLLYFKALLHDHRIIKAIKQNWNLELAGVFMRLSHAILGNLIS